MGIPDSSLLDLIEKFRSWISWGGSDLQTLSGEIVMTENSSKMCCECNRNLSEISLQFLCQSCGRWLCGKCVRGYEIPVAELKDVKNMEDRETIKFCKFCFDVNVKCEGGRKYGQKVHPSASLHGSPRESPEPQSPCFSVDSERISCSLTSELSQSNYFESPHAVIDRSMASFSSHHPSLVSARESPSRSDEDEAEDSDKHFFSPSSEYFHHSDIESSSLSARHDFNNYKSMESSPSGSPSMISTSSRIGLSVQHERERCAGFKGNSSLGQETTAILRKPELVTEDADNTDYCSDDLSVFQNQNEKMQRPLDFENNGLIWSPPPPDDEDGDVESNFFAYDDEDDDMGDSGALFSSSSSLSSVFPAKEKHNESSNEPLRAVVHGHFRALVSQLLQGEGIKLGIENGSDDWLDIVVTLSWQAANFVRPDTSRGGSMDPGDYVKVKCIACGSPRESILVKGVVCTKNIKHKRMTSQHKNPRLLLLGGALEYQKIPNQLASFDMLLTLENVYFKMIISKIEALRPNVLLVEKSVSSYAQEQLLEKDISLVLNVKRPLLERIARCTGALITPSIDNISAARLGHCELFRLEKMVEEHETANQVNKKPSKTLMFFEGCPRRLGCTVLLRGACREELKKVKHVFQYAVFAAYHLSLETSFLADEGASLPKMTLKHSITMPDRDNADGGISLVSDSVSATRWQTEFENTVQKEELVRPGPELPDLEILEHHGPGIGFPSYADTSFGLENAHIDTCNNCLASNLASKPDCLNKCYDSVGSNVGSSSIRTGLQSDLQETVQRERQHEDTHELTKSEGIDGNELSSEYFSSTDGHQSILVYFSSHCVSKGMVCERSRLLRIKFYGCFDKPLGRYLRDDLFNQSSICQTCKEPAEAHILCFTHQQGNLTINVRCLPSHRLPGEQDGKIWMWHRCLRCAPVDGVPPATRRVVMSDAAWGLSFGKFLELSFSNHATANRVATCGHSLQRDCLRYYGFGSMIAFFRYSPIDILSVHLPLSVLEFTGHIQQDWVRKEAAELLGKVQTLYLEIADALECLEQKRVSLGFGNESVDACQLQNHIMELKDLLFNEKSDYNSVLHSATVETPQPGGPTVDILELNRLRRSLLIGSHVWDHRLHSLDSLLKKISGSRAKQEDQSHVLEKETVDSSLKDFKCDGEHEQDPQSSKIQGSPIKDLQGEIREPNLPLEPRAPEDLMLMSSHPARDEEICSDGEICPSSESNLSERIDSAWTGTEPQPSKNQHLQTLQMDSSQALSARQIDQNYNPPFRRSILPVRVQSFDSALSAQERIRNSLPPSLYFSAIRSFHASGEYRNMVRDPLSNITRSYPETLPWEEQKLNLILSSTPSIISSASHMAEGVRLLLPQTGDGSKVIAVYDDEPTSIISYALSSSKYEDWVADKLHVHEGSWIGHERSKEDSMTSSFAAWQPFGSLNLDYIHYGSYGSEDASSISALLTDSKKSPHLRISFGDDSLNAGGKVNFSVTCYFAKQFDSLRKKCCPNEVDFIRSLSRCRRWSAQGGKSNVYFAKSLDERFIIKQVTKTELDSFEEFAPQYFKYLTDALSSGSPTCLAKVLGIYQVTVKHMKGGKEIKMDLMVMENLFFKRSISRVYDLKGSLRSRYNPDTTGTNKVLLDMNLLETLGTKPIFLGSKAKRSLERAVWNDTSFLASVDVMDYSLLVGVDEEQKELVLGIIDFMRQYTWDKHLETWVKASGILGGPKNASPTVISPKQYKKRFRKAMTAYFLTVPDPWSP